MQVALSGLQGRAVELPRSSDGSDGSGGSDGSDGSDGSGDSGGHAHGGGSNAAADSPNAQSYSAAADSVPRRHFHSALPQAMPPTKLRAP